MHLYQQILLIIPEFNHMPIPVGHHPTLLVAHRTLSSRRPLPRAGVLVVGRLVFFLPCIPSANPLRPHRVSVVPWDGRCCVCAGLLGLWGKSETTLTHLFIV